MGIREKIEQLKFVKDYLLVKKYGENIHDVDLTESIQTGVVERLMSARDLGINYAVVLGNVLPMSKSWDKYGDGTWKPVRDYITTDDIATPDHNRDLEEQKIFDFLRGKPATKKKEEEKGKSL